MSTFTRRTFLKSAILASSVTALQSMSTFSGSNKYSSNKLLLELENLNVTWHQYHTITAAEYLSMLPQEIWSDTSLIKNVILDEFKAGRVIEVNGLILSQTEVAFSAVYLDEVYSRMLS